MKLIYLLIFALISDIFCMTKVGKDTTFISSPPNGKGNFYIELAEFSRSENVYLYLETNGYINEGIHIKYSNDLNENGGVYESVKSYASVNTHDLMGYYYKLDAKRGYNNIIVKYFDYSGGHLTIKVTDTNPLSSLIKTIIIVVCSVVGVIIIIAVVVVVVLCLRRKTTVGFVGGINNIQPITPPNPQDPLVNPYPQPVYQNPVQTIDNLYNKPE